MPGERGRTGVIVAHQQHGTVVAGAETGYGLDQSRGKGRVAGTEARRCSRRSGRPRPVARRYVVNHVVELQRRDRRSRRGQGRTYAIKSTQIAEGAGEDRIDLRQVERRIPRQLIDDLQRQANDRRRPAPLVCTEKGDRIIAGQRPRPVCRRLAQGAKAFTPTGEARSDHGNRFDICRSHRLAPKIRVQLLPPKPKELVKTRPTGCARFRSTMRALRAGSNSVVLSVAGMKACLMLRMERTASAMPAAPWVWPVHPLVPLQAMPPPKRRGTARSSDASLAGVPLLCRLM